MRRDVGHALPEVLVAASVLGLSWASAQWVQQQTLSRAAQAAQMSKAARELTDTLNDRDWQQWPATAPDTTPNATKPATWRDPHTPGESTTHLLHARLPWYTRFGQQQTLNQIRLQTHWPATTLAAATLSPEPWHWPTNSAMSTPAPPSTVPWWASRQPDGSWTSAVDGLTLWRFNAEGVLTSKCDEVASNPPPTVCNDASGHVLHGWLKASFNQPLRLQGGDPLPALTLNVQTTPDTSTSHSSVSPSPPAQCQLWLTNAQRTPTLPELQTTGTWPVPAPTALVYQCHIPSNWSAAEALAHLQIIPASQNSPALPAQGPTRLCRVVGGLVGDTPPAPTWREHLLMLPADATCPVDEAQFLYSLPLTSP